MGWMALMAGISLVAGLVEAKRAREAQSAQMRQVTAAYGPQVAGMIPQYQPTPVLSWAQQWTPQFAGAAAFQQQQQQRQGMYGPGSPYGAPLQYGVTPQQPMFGPGFGGFPPSGMPGYYQYGQAPSAMPFFPPQQQYPPMPQYQMPQYPPMPQYRPPPQLPAPPPYLGWQGQVPTMPQATGPGLNPLYFTGAF